MCFIACVLLVILYTSVDSTTAIASENIVNPSSGTTGSATNSFVTSFLEAVKSSNTLAEIFDFRQLSGQQVAENIYKGAVSTLSSWGATNAENYAALTTKHIPKNLSTLPWETFIRVYGSSMANYLASEGILNERNADMLAKAYAKSYKYFATNEETKIAATKLGLLTFAASLTQLTAERE
ncbi:hypothetical protein TNCT_319941 [Trichonephila clavata]|uniref:Uncharacterized protein n=1 Tax=Trichonephila clavata TaxID=2740835 RepID=A0A8X6LT60_TRICU|nr:hypothetical protein TNCT_319941 [Trichonephila clavata]